MAGEIEKDKEEVVSRTGSEVLRPVLRQALDALQKRSDNVADLLAAGEDVSDAIELEVQAVQHVSRVLSLAGRLDGNDDVKLGLKTELEALGIKEVSAKPNADA